MPRGLTGVEERLLAEGRITSHDHLAIATQQQREELRQLRLHSIGRRRVARSIDQPQALLRLGQRDYQRVIGQGALVREVRSLLLIAVDRMHVAIQIHDGSIDLLAPMAPTPDGLLPDIDRTVQGLQARGVEASQEVARGRNPHGSQHAPDRLTSLQMANVLDARASHEEVVDVRQHMVRLRKGPVRLQQTQRLVQGTRNAEAPHQRNRHGQATVGRRFSSLLRHLERGVAKHRPRSLRRAEFRTPNRGPLIDVTRPKTRRMLVHLRCRSGGSWVVANHTIPPDPGTSAF